LREQELEVDRLTQELESTRGFLRGTQTTLQESESRSEELLEEIRQRSTSPILVDTQIHHSVTSLEDVGGLAEEHQLMEEPEVCTGSLMSMESYGPGAHERIFETVRHSPTHGGSRARGSFDDTSICVPRGIDLHVEVDLVVHPGSMMLQGYTGDYLSMQEHTVVIDDSQRHAEVYSEIQRGVLMCREETHFGEHVDALPLQQHIVMRGHLRSISSCMGDETWRVVRPKPPDMSAFTAYSRTEVGRDGQTVEALCVMMSIIGQMIADNSEADTDTDTHEDEHGGLPTVISLTQEQPAETGSDKLPSFPWDPGVILLAGCSC
jgi:hypothetical protein